MGGKLDHKIVSVETGIWHAQGDFWWDNQRRGLGHCPVGLSWWCCVVLFRMWCGPKWRSKFSRGPLQDGTWYFMWWCTLNDKLQAELNLISKMQFHVLVIIYFWKSFNNINIQFHVLRKWSKVNDVILYIKYLLPYHFFALKFHLRRTSFLSLSYLHSVTRWRAWPLPNFRKYMCFSSISVFKT